MGASTYMHNGFGFAIKQLSKSSVSYLFKHPGKSSEHKRRWIKNTNVYAAGLQRDNKCRMLRFVLKCANFEQVVRFDLIVCQFNIRTVCCTSFRFINDLQSYGRRFVFKKIVQSNLSLSVRRFFQVFGVGIFLELINATVA
jgi:hypothetical protein